MKESEGLGLRLSAVSHCLCGAGEATKPLGDLGNGQWYLISSLVN